MTKRWSSLPKILEVPHLRGLPMLALGLLVVVGALLPGDARAADAKASRYYEDALVRYEKQDLEGAIIQLKNALQIDNAMLPVQMLLGKVLLSKGDVAAAEIALREAMRLGVNRAEAVLPLGRAVVAQGKQKLLFEQPEFALAGLPDGVRLELLLLRASAKTDLGDVAAALQGIAEARGINPRAVAVWLAEVPIRIRARQFREATAAADQALTLAPDSAEAWYQKGSVLHASGALREASAAYDKSLVLDARHAEALVARTGLNLDFGRLKEAAADAEQLRLIDPKEPRGAYLRALLAERDNKPKEAQAALRELTALIDPVPMDFIRYRSQLLLLNGLAHFGLNEREKAKVYLQAFQQGQNNTAAAKLLAQIYLGESNTDRAIEVLESYLKSNTGDGQAMTLLASALIAKGQHSRATTLMQEALQSRDAPEFRTALGISLLRGGQTGSAVKELETALKLNPRQTSAATTLAALYLQSGQAAKAVPIVEKLTRQQPANAEFHNLLGKARGQTGNPAGARAAFEQAIALDGKLESPRLNLARLEIADKAYAAAAKRLNEVVQLNDKNAEAMSLLGVLFERQGRLEDAERWLKRASDFASARDSQWGLPLLEFYLRHGRTAPALEFAKRLYGKTPEDLPVLMAYARAQLANGDRIGARSTLVTATKAAGYGAGMQVQIAGLQMAANNPSGAAYSLEKAFSSQPGYLPAMAMMTEVEMRQGEFDKADARAREIIKAAPKRGIGHHLRGDIALTRGQSAGALEAYRRAHQLEPSTDTLLKIFNILARGKDEKSAAQLAEQWLKTHPADLRVQLALADSHARRRNYPAARAAYEKLASSAPNDGAILNSLANVLFRMKDPGAIKLAEQAVARNPTNANAIDTLGWILFQDGQHDRALQLLRDARLRQPENPEILYHLAAILARTGRVKEAREELEAALKTGRPFEGDAEAAALLKTLK